MSVCNIEIKPFTIPIQGIEIRNTSIIKEISPFTIPNQGSLRKYFSSNKNKMSTHPYLSPLSYTDHLASNRKTWASPLLGNHCRASRSAVLYATSPLATSSAAKSRKKHLSTNNNNAGTNIPNIGSTGSNPGCILGRRCPPKPPESCLMIFLSFSSRAKTSVISRPIVCFTAWRGTWWLYPRTVRGLLLDYPCFPSVCGSRQKPLCLASSV